MRGSVLGEAQSDWELRCGAAAVQPASEQQTVLADIHTHYGSTEELQYTGQVCITLLTSIINAMSF